LMYWDGLYFYEKMRIWCIKIGIVWILHIKLKWPPIQLHGMEFWCIGKGCVSVKSKS
jgi:hypothetical protein